MNEKRMTRVMSWAAGSCVVLFILGAALPSPLAAIAQVLWSILLVGILFLLGVFALMWLERIIKLAKSGVSTLEHNIHTSPRCQCPHCDSTISINAHICPFCRMEVSLFHKPEKK